MFDPSGKVALVTGGGRGIGRAIALGLAAAGADVAINYVADAAQAEEVAGDIRDKGLRGWRSSRTCPTGSRSPVWSGQSCASSGESTSS